MPSVDRPFQYGDRVSLLGIISNSPTLSVAPSVIIQGLNRTYEVVVTPGDLTLDTPSPSVIAAGKTLTALWAGRPFSGEVWEEDNLLYVGSTIVRFADGSIPHLLTDVVCEPL
jgi:hypothetical protein